MMRSGLSSEVRTARVRSDAGSGPATFARSFPPRSGRRVSGPRQWRRSPGRCGSAGGRTGPRAVVEVGRHPRRGPLMFGGRLDGCSCLATEEYTRSRKRTRMLVDQFGARTVLSGFGYGLYQGIGGGYGYGFGFETDPAQSDPTRPDRAGRPGQDPDGSADVPGRPDQPGDDAPEGPAGDPDGPGRRRQKPGQATLSADESTKNQLETDTATITKDRAIVQLDEARLRKDLQAQGSTIPSTSGPAPSATS